MKTTPDNLKSDLERSAIPAQRMRAVKDGTMTNIISLDFEGQGIRAVRVGGEPYFVGKDVAERLGYVNATDAINKHCRGVAKRYPIVDALGRTQEARILAEPDVLRLIIASKLPAAERFERWTFEEVLPAIRRDGGYMAVAGDETPEALALRAMTVLQAAVQQQKAQLADALPKAVAFDRLSATQDALPISAAAKVLQIGQGRLFDTLEKRRWIFRRGGDGPYLGFAAKVSAGLLTHRVATIHRPDGSDKAVTRVLVTPRGIARLAVMLAE